MRFGALLAVLLAASVWVGACSGRGLFRQYEYEEDVYLSLDGSAVVYVNASLAALNVLRGSSFDLSPSARFDRDAVGRFFSTPATHVATVTNSRRSNRRFAHVRLTVEDVRRLGAAAPFAWSVYQFGSENGALSYHQTIGAPVHQSAPEGIWSGSEIVAFRLHLPSTVVGTNGAKAISMGVQFEEKRGNILAWEQRLADRLQGRPIDIGARMETESILSHTLRLFGATFAAVAVTLMLLVWWIMRRGGKPVHT